ncbi:MAG TPA: MlaD family protein [Verrucomicrobiae bacterium]|jgi:phospholipid/cholesterol/gamma-HCH transport system substrate-binding protein|nr:MlaD family protein [Verrucomicrobiae bacterium]
MAGKRDQVFVGLFVIVATAVLIGMVFAISGAFGRTAKTYHAYFPFAGGLEQGATVRYAGGPKVGRVEKLAIDPKNPAQIDVVFTVQTDLPVKTDSHTKIMSMSPLGDNHLEILPGGAQTALAPPGSLLPSDPYVDFNALTAQINDLAPQAKQLIQSLNDRATELKVTVDRVNDLLSAQNRANLSATLADTRGLIEDNRKQITSTIQHLDAASQKVEPLLQDLHKTSDEANKALTHIDELLGENRADVRQAVTELRKSLTTLTDITSRIDQTLDVNSENIDELLDNFRRVSMNLKEFTDTIKKRPYTLIRATNPTEHKPGEKQ